MWDRSASRSSSSSWCGARRAASGTSSTSSCRHSCRQRRCLRSGSRCRPSRGCRRCSPCRPARAAASWVTIGAAAMRWGGRVSLTKWSQEATSCAERCTFFAPLLARQMRSVIASTEPKAQHEPQLDWSRTSARLGHLRRRGGSSRVRTRRWRRGRAGKVGVWHFAARGSVRQSKLIGSSTGVGSSSTGRAGRKSAGVACFVPMSTCKVAAGGGPPGRQQQRCMNYGGQILLDTGGSGRAEIVRRQGLVGKAPWRRAQMQRQSGSSSPPSSSQSWIRPAGCAS